VRRPLSSRRRARRALGVAGALSVAVSALGLQLAGSTPAVAGVTSTGSGSSYAAVALNNWVGQVANLYGLSINYQTSSSVLGLDGFVQHQVDFAASEIGYNAGQANGEPPPGTYQYLPDVAGATCLMYNLQSSTQQPVQDLQLSSAVMMGVFSGTITNWNDPAIAALNPGVLLPNRQIGVVYRTDASGDNYLFSDYLSNTQPGQWAAFNHAVTPNYSIPSALWPAPSGGSGRIGPYDMTGFNGQAGSDNSSNYVAANPGTITYVETAYAILHGMPCAAVQNASGAFVQPSSVADAIALTHDCLNADLTQNLGGCNGQPGVYQAPEPAAYPISAYSYLVTSTTGMSVDKAAVLAKFINFLACQGQVSAGQLGYSPIPPNLILDDFAAIGRLPGQSPPPAPTAESCPNPYLTGAAEYVGGPVQLTTGGSGAVSGGAPSNVSVAGVKQVSAADLSKQLTAKAHGGLLAAPGQHLGVALNAAVADLLKVSGPTAGILAVTAVFIVLLVVPPVIGLLRRRLDDSSDPEGGDS